MSLITGQEIPGYQEALEREKSLRNLAMDGQDVPLLGRIVQQFTLRHMVRLGGCNSPFIIGGPVDLADVAMFLWFISPDYSLDKTAREAFFKEAVRLDFEAARLEIKRYLDDAFWDNDSGSAASGVPVLVKSYYSYAARLVSLFGERFGWDDDAVMDKPVARLFQYERVIQKRLGLPISNRTDGFLSKWMAERNSLN